MPLIRFFKARLIVLGLALLSGCAGSGKHPGTEQTQKPQNFAAYAEDVFRRQNNATSRIMTLMPEDLSDDEQQYEALLNAEKDMHKACEQINDYAQRTQDGENVGVLMRSRVGVSIKDCDRATLNVETLLSNIDHLMAATVQHKAK